MLNKISQTSAVSLIKSITTEEETSSSPPHPQLQDKCFLPVEDPIDLEIKKAVEKKLIDVCCNLNPGIEIDKSSVISELSSCVNDELSNKHLNLETSQKITEKVSLKTILQWFVDTKGAELPITSFTFFGSSILYKLADPIINAINASDAKDLASPLFEKYLKNPPFDSDWKVVIGKPLEGSNISFWDAVECYTKELLRNIARIKLGKDLDESIDIPAACELLGIDYDPKLGQFIHLYFKEDGIDLSIGHFEDNGLFKDTYPEIKVCPKSFKDDPDNLKVELNDSLVSIFQAAIFRGFKVLSLQDAINSQNPNGMPKFIRRSLNGYVCFSAEDYRKLLHDFFEQNPLSGSRWASTIAKKFCNLIMGHTKSPVDMILWALFLFLNSTKKDYPISEVQEDRLWKNLPQIYHKQSKGEKPGLVCNHPLYQFFLFKPAALFEGILGIAGLLSLSLKESNDKTSYSLRRHQGKDKISLSYHTEAPSQCMEVQFEPNLLTFCKSVKQFYDKNPGYKSSKGSKALLDRFVSLIDISNLGTVSQSVIKKNSSELPCPTSECADIACSFISSSDPFLVLAGVSILMVLRDYPPEYVNETLFTKGIPLLISSDEQILKDFGIAYAKQLLSLANIDSLFHPTSGKFLIPLWLNKLAAMKPYCRIAAKHWMVHVSAEKNYFQPYTQFLRTLWNADPDGSAKVWQGLIVHTFDEEQISSLFELYANKLIDMPEKDMPWNCLESFMLFINANISHLKANVHRATLYKLVQKIASVYPNGLSQCMSWLPLLPPKAYDVYRLGSIQDTVWKKIEEAKEPKDKDNLFNFLHANSHLAGMFPLLLSPQLAAFFDENRLQELFLSFIEKSTSCPRQRTHLALKLIDKISFSILEESIKDILDNLLKQEPLPVSLLLKLFKSAFKATQNYTVLSEPLITFVEKLLANRLNDLTPVAKLVCKLDRFTLSQNVIVFDLLKRLIFEGTSKAFDISITLATSLKGALFIDVSKWESLIEALKLAAYHQEKASECFKKVLDFQNTFDEFKKACYQTDLDLLALEINLSDKCAEVHLESLIAIKDELAKSKPLLKQLCLLTLVFMKKKIENTPKEVTKWLKSLPCKQLLNDDERIEIASKVVLKHFDETLFTLVLNELKTASKEEVKKSYLCAFADQLIMDEQHLYHECEASVDRVDRLLTLHPYCTKASLEKWHKLLYIELRNAIDESYFTESIKFFQHSALNIQSDSEFAKIYNTLIATIPSRILRDSNHLLNSLCKHHEILTLEAWKNCIGTLKQIKDKKIIAKILSCWARKYPFTEVNLLTNISEEEKGLHLEIISFLFSHAYPLKDRYLKQLASIEYLINHFSDERQTASAKGLLLTYYTEEARLIDSQDKILSLLDKVSTVNDIVLLFESICLILKLAYDKKLLPLYQKAFQLLKTSQKDFSNPKVTQAFQSQKGVLSLTFANNLEIPFADTLSELYHFLLPIKELFVHESNLWLRMLEIFVDNGSNIFLSNPERPTAFIFLGYILSLFDKPIPKELMKDYKDLFTSQKFIAFIQELCRGSREIESMLLPFFCSALKAKVLNDNYTSVYALELLQKKYSETHCPKESKLDLLKTYFNFLPFFYNDVDIDQQSTAFVVDTVIRLMTENGDLTSFKLYSQKLLNYSYHPLGASNTTYFKYKARLTLESTMECDLPEDAFDYKRFIHFIENFTHRILSQETDITANSFNAFLPVAALYIFGMFTSSKIFSDENTHNIITLIKQLIYFPRPANQTGQNVAVDTLDAFLLRATTLGYFVKDSNEHKTLRLYNEISLPVKKTAGEYAYWKLQDIHLIGLMAGECMTLSPLSYLNFVQNLRNHAVILPAADQIDINLDIASSLITPLKKTEKLPWQIKYLCKNHIHAILEQLHLFTHKPENIKSHQVREKLISFQVEYQTFLMDINKNIQHLSKKENWNVVLEAYKTRSYVLDGHANLFTLADYEEHFSSENLALITRLHSQHLIK